MKCLTFDLAMRIWSRATLKFAFISCLEILNKISTMNREVHWNRCVNTCCVLC